MKILFLGDSITDTGRNTGSGSLVSIGQGYALIADARLSVDYPQKFEFINRGISGNRIVDIYARIKADCWNLEPDVISLLIGVNDVWHEVGNKNGVDAKRFERIYSMLISDTLERLPRCKFMILEPFVLHGGATDEKWDIFTGETALRAEAARRVAAETKQLFLPLQRKFDEACSLAPSTYWLGDGVHPTPAGHQLIADAWLDAFKNEIM